MLGKMFDCDGVDVQP